MAMFGRTKPRDPLAMPGVISGIGGGTWNVDGTQATPIDRMSDPMPPAMTPQQPQSDPRWMEGGKFGVKDGIGLALGAIGDAFTGQPTSAAMIQDGFAQQRDMKRREQQRTTEMSDWLWKQQWERDNPKPVRNDTVLDYDFRAQKLGQAEADKWLQRSGDPLVNTTLPNGQFYSGPQSGLATALGGGQQPAAPDRPSQPKIVQQRPEGLSDEQLFEQGHEAVRNGANVEEVFRQLQAWGVNP